MPSKKLEDVDTDRENDESSGEEEWVENPQPGEEVFDEKIIIVPDGQIVVDNPDEEEEEAVFTTDDEEEQEEAELTDDNDGEAYKNPTSHNDEIVNKTGNAIVDLSKAGREEQLVKHAMKNAKTNQKKHREPELLAKKNFKKQRIEPQISMQQVQDVVNACIARQPILSKLNGSGYDFSLCSDKTNLTCEICNKIYSNTDVVAITIHGKIDDGYLCHSCVEAVLPFIILANTPEVQSECADKFAQVLQLVSQSV